MSVNEVKVQQAPVAFQVRGTGPAGSRTFCIGNEDHTLGNSIRHVLMQDRKVGFAGYSVPHPSEPVVHIRVQTSDGKTTAKEALKESCQTLHDQCSVVLEKLEDVLPEVKEDRIRMEKIALEEGFADEEGGDEEAMEEDDDTQ